MANRLMVAVNRRHDPLTALRVALLVIMLAFASRTQSDTDLWGHVTYGGLIATTHSIPRHDPYSFTSDQSWVNHEWLSELIMYEAYRSAGAGGLIALRLTVLAAVLALVAWALRRTRPDPLVHDVTLAVLVIGTYAQTAVVRPQLFSILLFTVLLMLLTTRRGWTVLSIGVPVLFAVWSNLHGGWILGAGMLGIWVACDAAERLRARRSPWPPVLLLAGSIMATLVNPYGTEIVVFLHDTVGPIRADVQEWQPVFVLGLPFVFHWAFVVAFVALVVVRSPRRLERYQWLMLIALGVASFQLARVIGFFAVGAVVLLLPQLEAMVRRRPEGMRRAAPVAVTIGCWALCLATVGWAAPRAVRRIGCIELGKRMPEAEVVPLIRAEQLSGRMVTWFDWGQYAIWYLYPRVRVSYDGRRETVYSERVRGLHGELYRGTRAGRDYLATLDADIAWLPTSLQAVPMLRQAGWSEWFRGPVSVVLVRKRAPAAPIMWSGSPARRCFPGP
jgi:hypothetical protein